MRYHCYRQSSSKPGDWEPGLANCNHHHRPAAQLWRRRRSALQYTYFKSLTVAPNTPLQTTIHNPHSIGISLIPPISLTSYTSQKLKEPLFGSFALLLFTFAGFVQHICASSDLFSCAGHHVFTFRNFSFLRIGLFLRLKKCGHR